MFVSGNRLLYLFQNFSPGKWLQENAHEHAKIGYDPWLYTQAQIDQLKADFEEKNIDLVGLDHNTVFKLWRDRPAFRVGNVIH